MHLGQYSASLASALRFPGIGPVPQNAPGKEARDRARGPRDLWVGPAHSPWLETRLIPYVLGWTERDCHFI